MIHFFCLVDFRGPGQSHNWLGRGTGYYALKARFPSSKIVDGGPALTANALCLPISGAVCCGTQNPRAQRWVDSGFRALLSWERTATIHWQDRGGHYRRLPRCIVTRTLSGDSPRIRPRGMRWMGEPPKSVKFQQEQHCWDFYQSGSAAFRGPYIFAPTLQIELYGSSAQPATCRWCERLPCHGASNSEYLAWHLVTRDSLFLRLRQPFQAAQPCLLLTMEPAGFSFLEWCSSRFVPLL